MDSKKPCAGECPNLDLLGFDVSIAFQPIVDLKTKCIFSQEALVRGTEGQSAGTVFSQVDADNRYSFDQLCRIRAIEWASQLDISTYLNINFMPLAVYDAKTCLRQTLKIADEKGFPLSQIIFEVTEGEKVDDHEHVKGIILEYQKQGFKTAIDDFGAGYSGLNLLAEFQPDFIKLDLKLIQGIHQSNSRQAILRGIVQVCRDLNIEIIAEGIEVVEELEFLHSEGVFLIQGFLFSKPRFESLCTNQEITWA